MSGTMFSSAMPYPFVAGRGLLQQAGRLIREYAGELRRAVVLTDPTVRERWGDPLEAALCRADIEVRWRLMDEWTDGTALGERDGAEMLVGLGGGSVGAVCAMAARRGGIDYVLLPTTLRFSLEEGVDERSGDCPPPLLVLCDTACFDTLPERQLSDGMASLVKYGVCFDRSLADALYGQADLTEAVGRCAEIRASVRAAEKAGGTAADQQDRLRFGHTVGGAIRRLFGAEFTPGEALAVGMVIEARSAVRAGLCRRDILPELAGLLTYHGLPVAVDCSREELLAEIFRQKEAAGRRIRLALPSKWGACALHEFTAEELQGFLCLQ
ncbi:MAG: iron-containing alcohol dehydrogenase [Eubacteriales bacterium]